MAADSPGPLFDWTPAPSPPKASAEVQEAELERVSSRLRRSIIDFCRRRVGKEFFADELRAHVEKECGPVAPGSADRVLRALRQDRELAYRVINRRKSLYLVEGA